MERHHVDALVVGAGPAGSAAATVLARSGHQVLLCDRHDFPRDKPCGDLIGVRALTAARALGIDEATFGSFSPLRGALLLGDGKTVDLSPRSNAGRSILRGSDARVIPRRVFDAALVANATLAGARSQNTTIRTVGPWDAAAGVRLVSARTSAGPAEFVARRVVIAGGYGCLVAPELHLDHPKLSNDPPRGIAMRGYLTNVRGLDGRIAFCLDEWMLPGYGWVFPLPHGAANVGVGTLAHPANADSESLRRLYHRFVNDPASPIAPYVQEATPVEPPRTWSLDLGPRRRRIAAPGLVVAGEAAGLVGPLTGAGIAFALESGMRSGKAVAASLSADGNNMEPLRRYASVTSRRTLPWLRAELCVQRWLSDPNHVARALGAMELLPGSGLAGARVLLHLG